MAWLWTVYFEEVIFAEHGVEAVPDQFKLILVGGTGLDEFQNLLLVLGRDLDPKFEQGEVVQVGGAGAHLKTIKQLL